MNKSQPFTLTLAVVLLLYVENAVAGFQLVEPEPTQEEAGYPYPQRSLTSIGNRGRGEWIASAEDQPVAMTVAGLRHIGYADIDPRTVRKGGRSIPLPFALKRILPPGWHARKNPEVESTMTVTWTGGWDWVTTLEDIAQYHHLAFTLDWDHRIVTVERPTGLGKGQLVEYRVEDEEGSGEITSTKPVRSIRPAVFRAEDATSMMAKYVEPEEAAPKVSSGYTRPSRITSAQEHQDEVNLVEAITPKINDKPKPGSKTPPQLPLPTYTISPGETLRSVLTRWTKDDGWGLVWEPSNDFVLAAGATFGGDMKVAITGLMESLRDNGAAYGAELYNGNRIVRVVRVR